MVLEQMAAQSNRGSGRGVICAGAPDSVNITIRADASPQAGVGHVMRCLTLADFLKDRGARVRFVCDGRNGGSGELVRNRGYELHLLPYERLAADTEEDVGSDQAQIQDAALTTQFSGDATDWTIVDHYGLGVVWERAVQQHSRRVMVVEDLPNRHHFCDVLLDQNETVRQTTSYVDRVPRSCNLLLGARYALLHRDFARHPSRLRNRDGRVDRVLVYFGGNDTHDLTRTSVKVLSNAEFRHLWLDVIVSSTYLGAPELERLIRLRGNAQLLGPQPNLADVLATADLAIGAGGTTTWERMCMGVPSLVVCAAENQRPGCDYLAAQGAIHLLGDAREATSSAVGDALRQILGSPIRLRSMVQVGRRKVDGLGAARVRELMIPSPLSALRLRPAEPSDVFLYFDWASDPEVRCQSLNSELIEIDKHIAWFAQRLQSQDCLLFVLLAGELPVGQIRFDFVDGEAVIDYSIDQCCRGRGWGKHLVRLGMQALTRSAVLRADVKRTNVASCAVFESLGFVESTSADAELRVFRSSVSRCA